jgi:AraC family transcriptional regulator
VHTSALATGSYFGRPERQRAVGSLDLCRTTYAPHQRIPEHLYDGPYLCLAVRGAFRERSGSSEAEVVAGSAVLHRPGERHADRFGERLSSCLNVAFRPEWSAFSGDLLSEQGPALYASPGRVGPLVQKLAGEFELGDEASGLAIEGLTLELLSVFVRDEHRGERCAPRWMAATLERLRDEEHVSLAVLAREAGVHPSTLARSFRRLHGCSLGEFRRRWRLARAIEALRNSDAPLAEIAARTGFADQSHLTRALRAETGTTPAALRNRARST